MKETIKSFVPMATIYAIASLIALLRHGRGGFRRWGRMNLWLVGSIAFELFGGADDNSCSSIILL
jgi:hypothetical protein